jgi:hypothetical protein
VLDVAVHPANTTTRSIKRMDAKIIFLFAMRDHIFFINFIVSSISMSYHLKMRNNSSFESSLGL